MLKQTTLLFIVHITAVFWLIPLVPNYTSAYELQDTIQTLKEENFQLQHRLENLTRALRDLKHLLKGRIKVTGGELDSDYIHAWREWSQRGISSETHQILAQALCFTEVHDTARPINIASGLFFLLISLIHTLLL